MTGNAGRVVVISGGASGLGLGVVERFLEEGARVVVLDRSEDRLQELESRYEKEETTVAGSVTEYGDCRRAVETAVDCFGRLDVVVANAGIWDFIQPFSQLSPNDLESAYEEIFSVNVKGILLLSHAALEPLRAARGSLIATLSYASFRTGGGGVLYTASKHAGLGIVRQLAHELAPQVRVNGVAPGACLSDLRGPKAMGMDSLSVRSVVEGQEDALFGPPDYAGVFTFLASDRESRSLSGSVLECFHHTPEVSLEGLGDTGGSRP